MWSTPNTVASPAAKPIRRPKPEATPFAFPRSGKSSEATAARIIPALRFCGRGAHGPVSRGLSARSDSGTWSAPASCPPWPTCLKHGLYLGADLHAHEQQTAEQHACRRQGAHAGGIGGRALGGLRHGERTQSARASRSASSAAHASQCVPRRAHVRLARLSERRAALWRVIRPRTTSRRKYRASGNGLLRLQNACSGDARRRALRHAASQHSGCVSPAGADSCRRRLWCHPKQ